jgi:hypothetical protein
VKEFRPARVWRQREPSTQGRLCGHTLVRHEIDSGRLTAMARSGALGRGALTTGVH